MSRLTVVIVGAGIAGLTCAIALSHYPGIHVTVLEKELVHVAAGNGIQVPCNACHVLRSLGLLGKLIAKAGGIAQGSVTLDYQDSRVLLNRDFSDYGRIYGAPWLLVHRADYIEVLLEEAQRLGIEIRLGCEVKEVNFEHPWVRIGDEEIVAADVVVGCDGLNSSIRNAMHPTIRPQYTDTFAYRALLNYDQLPSHLLEPSSSTPECRIWVGPSAHVVFYPVRDGKQYNLVLLIADDEFNNNYKRWNILEAVREHFHGWNPTVRALLDAVKELVVFPLRSLEPLPLFTHGSVVLIGDAAHPTFPYLGQGAAMAVEDSLIVATLLGKLTSSLSSPNKSRLSVGIKAVLQSYNGLQWKRTNKIVAQSRKNGYFNHLPRGPEQRDRDAEYAAFEAENTKSKCPWIDSTFNHELLGRNAEAIAVAEFDRLVSIGVFDRLEPSHKRLSFNVKL